MTVLRRTRLGRLTAMSLAAALPVGCATPEPAATADIATDDEPQEQPSADGDTEPDPGDTEPHATGDATDEEASDEEASDEGAAAGTVAVEIGDFFFDDDQLRIGVGDTVTWNHQGDITHNVTARDESFVSDNLGSGDTFTHTFDDAGSFAYTCTLHGQMTAAVEVS